MVAKLTITGEVSQVRKVKSTLDNDVRWMCLDITTGGTGTAPKGLPMPSKDIQFTVLMNKKQYEKLEQEVNDADVKLVGGKVLIQGEITLDLSFDVLEGDMGVVAFQVESLDAKKKEQAEVKAEKKKSPDIIVQVQPKLVGPEQVEIKPKKKMPKSPMKVSSIQIPREFQEVSPSEKKIVKAVQYYVEHGSLDQEILLIKGEGGWVLHDGYTRYLAAKRLGLDEVAVGLYEEEGDN
jgi:hypothetical protein